VEGHLAWRRDGLIPPEHVTVATQQWRAENDPLADWLEERVTEAAAGVETFQALLNDYHWWAARLGIKRTISPKNFAARLGARGFIPGRTGRTNLRTYAGLILKHPQGPTKGEESSNAS
jgi:putative DNA primase/helicase